jgi:hypothetical protein
MAVCDVCGNDYDRSFEVRRDGETFVFDSGAADRVEVAGS